MNASDAAFTLIERFESYAKELPNGCCKAYPDPGTGGAPWTIGWGSTGPDIGPCTQWTRQEADDRFKADVAKVAANVTRLLGFAPTNQHQFDAFVSFAYNVGIANFGSSTLLRKHKKGDFVGAAAEFPKWNHANGKVMPGLTRRRAAEAELYRSGSW